MFYPSCYHVRPAAFSADLKDIFPFHCACGSFLINAGPVLISPPMRHFALKAFLLHQQPGKARSSIMSRALRLSSFEGIKTATVSGLLRGDACFGKTELMSPKNLLRPVSCIPNMASRSFWACETNNPIWFGVMVVCSCLTMTSLRPHPMSHFSIYLANKTAAHTPPSFPTWALASMSQSDLRILIWPQLLPTQTARSRASAQ